MDATLWCFILLLMGMALIFLEIFIPSGGLLSLMAAGAFIATLVVGFSESLVLGTIMLLVTTILVPLTVGIALKWWPHTPLGKLILIKRPDNEDDVLPDTEPYRRRKELVGKRGVAKSPLLPSGDVKVAGKIYDAVSDGMAIEAGQQIKVVAVRTQRLVVRPLNAKELAESEGAETSDDILSTPIDALGIDPFEEPPA
jgi:membrane-bound ClpP family serine protease